MTGKENCCLAIFAVIARSEATWQSPGPKEPGNDYHEKAQQFPLLMVIFGTFPLYPGVCHDQFANWSRNDRKPGTSVVNNNLQPDAGFDCFGGQVGVDGFGGLHGDGGGGEA